MFGDWNLDRKPTTKERWAVGFLVAIAFIFVGAIVLAWSYLILKKPNTFNFVFLFVCITIFLFLGNTLRRIIFGKPSKPSPKAQLIFGMLWFLFSLGILLIVIFSDPKLQGTSTYALGASLIGSIGWMKIAWQKLKNP